MTPATRCSAAIFAYRATPAAADLLLSSACCQVAALAQQSWAPPHPNHPPHCLWHLVHVRAGDAAVHIVPAVAAPQHRIHYCAHGWGLQQGGRRCQQKSSGRQQSFAHSMYWLHHIS